MKKNLLGIFFSAVICFITIGMSGCGEIVSEHYISASSSNFQNGGVTSGSGIYKTNSTVKLVAVPNINKTFIAWTKSDEVVSYDASYTFKANSKTEGKYIALFSNNNFDFAILNSANYDYSTINLKNENFRLSQILTLDLKYKTIATETADNIKRFATYNEATNKEPGFAIKTYPKVLYLSKTYMFELVIGYQYVGDNALSQPIDEVRTTFEINFNDVFQKSIDDNGKKIYTDPSNKYKLILEANLEAFSFTVEYYYLSKSIKWADDDTFTHTLSLEFNYPFNVEAES